MSQAPGGPLPLSLLLSLSERIACCFVECQLAYSWLWVKLSFHCRQLQQQNMPAEDFSSGLSGLQNVLDLRALVSDWQCSVCNILWVAHTKLFTSTTIQ